VLTVPDDDRLDLVFGAFANRKRRQIVETLALRPASITQLADEQESSLPAIHRHIQVLEEAGLAQRRKSGRVNFLALDRSGILTAQGWVGSFHAYWGTGDETLENYIAGIARSDGSTEGNLS
jgi:DNA-binding transcriptional ArsR family regulator